MRRLALLMVLLLIFATDAGCGRAPTLRENGGYVLTFHADSPDSGKEEAVATALSRRLRLSRLPHATVKVESKGVFVVELPGASETDLKWAMHLIGGGGHLEFRILARPGPDDEVIARAVAEHSGSDSSDFRWIPLNTEKITLDSDMVTRNSSEQAVEVLVLQDAHNVSGADLSYVYPGHDEALRPCLFASLTKDGASRMKAFTSQNLNRRLGIAFDGALITAPTIRSAIGDSLQLSGNFTQQEVDFMVALLKSGSLPVPLKREPPNVRKVEPQTRDHKPS